MPRTSLGRSCMETSKLKKDRQYSAVRCGMMKTGRRRMDCPCQRPAKTFWFQRAFDIATKKSTCLPYTEKVCMPFEAKVQFLKCGV